MYFERAMRLFISRCDCGDDDVEIMFFNEREIFFNMSRVINFILKLFVIDEYCGFFFQAYHVVGFDFYIFV